MHKLNMPPPSGVILKPNLWERKKPLSVFVFGNEKLFLLTQR